MKKGIFKRLLESLRKRDKHVSKARRFSKIVDNPAGSKFRKHCTHESRRAADGTMR